jgi:hypothetical protein
MSRTIVRILTSTRVVATAADVAAMTSFHIEEVESVLFSLLSWIGDSGYREVADAVDGGLVSIVLQTLKLYFIIQIIEQETL